METEQPEVPPAQLSPDEVLWETVNKNKNDWDSWVKLLSMAEQQGNIEKIRKYFDAFLKNYPLCYGYWEKYATMENVHSGVEQAISVYERGVVAVSRSVDLWTRYVSFLCVHKASEPDVVRNLFERAVEVCGDNWLSHQLLDKYLEFENSQEEYHKVAMLYKRILSLPIQELDRYYEGYKQFASMRQADDVMTAEERQSFEIIKVLKTEEAVIAEKVDRVSVARDQLYYYTKEDQYKISTYEAGLRRFYFHIKPLDEGQLNTWRQYLTYMENEGDYTRAVRLYERAMVPLCYYTEFWNRYASFVERKGKREDARKIYERAIVAVRGRSACHLQYAEFLEGEGSLEEARDMYKKALQINPNVAKNAIGYANFERRQGDINLACQILERAFNAVDSSSVPYLACYWAYFVSAVLKDQTRSRHIYEIALSKAAFSLDLWLAYIDFERAYDSSEATLRRIFERALGPGTKLSPADQDTLWQRYIEVGRQVFGSFKLVQQVEAQARDFQARNKDKLGAVSSKKRAAEDSAAQPQAKTARTTGASASSTPTSATPASSPAASAGAGASAPHAHTAAAGTAAAASAAAMAAYYPYGYSDYAAYYQQAGDYTMAAMT
eukprot:TRINITY_DN19100_c0_g1::TRINITY_DN19100_c0_g1_i1::g.13871::m.13871 TRINITY_DN19100_c0_g1::TRINITY_DN19100_c0_g1_i1::g.13871  ORF type:complete len:631 (+),score=178.25,sp/Q86UA1/PRP39_HUMAN/28.52/1e-65,TPR_14/PF13428.1/9.7,TPR_14/PF13428.1/2.6e+02,TPR_14/PF13428.1/0.76,TPR_14/PF13428.1/10,TPR_14/PF13428.1/0.0059,TPR_14/PF13428.1/1.1e+02,TPR_14/PF13428.1/5.9e+03,TPR_14/PF13428.1/2.6e+03,TPR_14/PF13428.1/7.1e+02,Suf/PF05843.9/1.7e-07,Suf/PF05843.9/18,Suf/PF05843.9/4.4,Suf/PF05843.9/0.015,TPR_16/PF1